MGVGVVALSSVGLALQGTKPVKPAQGLSVLSADEYAVLVAVADRLCPKLGPGAPGATALGVAQTADALIASAEVDAQEGLKTVLRVFENGLTGALFLERARPFSQLSADEQDRALAGWRDSRIGFRRTVYRALSTLVMALYFGDARTWERMGYPGPPSLSGLRTAYADNLVDLDALRASPRHEGG